MQVQYRRPVYSPHVLSVLALSATASDRWCRELGSTLALGRSLGGRDDNHMLLEPQSRGSITSPPRPAPDSAHPQSNRSHCLLPCHHLRAPCHSHPHDLNSRPAGNRANTLESMTTPI